nr:zinc finger, CCHC-type [Tanacetum cinerariifolium]
MTGPSLTSKKFDGTNDFALWKVRMKALLEQQRLAAGLEELHAATIVAYDNVIQKKTFSALILCLGDRKKLYTFQMHQSKSQSEHIDEFHKLVGDLTAIDTAILDDDQALLLLTSLPSSYDNFVETLLYGRDTLKLEDSEEHLKRDCPRYNHKKSQGFVRNEDQVSSSGADKYDSADVIMAMSVKQLLDWIMDSEGFYHMAYKRDYLFDFKEYNGDNVPLSDSRKCRVRGTCKVQVQMRDGSSFMLDNVRYVSELRRNLISLGTRKANCVYTLDGQAVTRKTLKGRKQLREYQATRKIKIDNVLDSCNQSMKQGMLEPVKVKCIFLGYHEGIVGDKLWRLDDVTSQVVLYRNMSFNESWEYKQTFIGSGVGMGSVQVLQGVEFEVEPQEDHAFEVEPQGNVDHVAGSQKEQTQDLICYHLACDKEQCLAHELLRYREDSNEAAFAVAAVEKIYAHESLTFNYTVTCEAEIWVTKGLLDKAKGNVLSMEIVRDQSGNTLRVSQSRFYNEKVVQTLLKDYSILSLKGSLSRDCDVEKNGKWSCIYAVGSQEYQMVCTRLDIASADVGSWEAMMPHMMALLITKVGCMKFTYAWKKEAISLKGLFGESGAELK